jgi:hypothetical protein
MDLRARERLVLGTGLVAAGSVALALVAGIAGSPLGDPGNRFVASLVLLYLCARMWGHGVTLEEGSTGEALGRTTRLGAPLIALLLLAQTWASSSIDIRLGLDSVPHLHVGLLTRLEWTADIAVFALFLLTATNVWTRGSVGWAALCSRIANVLVVVLALDLLGGAWGVVSLLPQIRLVGSLIVLSLGGTVVVATLRRLERLDELPAEG